MTTAAFENFIFAFGAARLLLRRAHDQGFLIEGMALYAALLDGFLRIGLVLKRQLKNRTSEIDETLIRQTKGGAFYSEHQVYHMAFQRIEFQTGSAMATECRQTVNVKTNS